MKRLFFLIGAFWFFLAIIFASLTPILALGEKAQVVYFYLNNCQECKEVKPLVDRIEKDNQSQIELLRFEVSQNQKNRNLYMAYAQAYNQDLSSIGVPMIYIGNDVLVGRQAIEGNFAKAIEKTLKSGAALKISPTEAGNFQSPLTGQIQCANRTVCQVSGSPLTLPIVALAAAGDSINPCAIAVLIILISYLLGMAVSRLRLLSIGLLYIGAVYLAYLLAGLGIMKFIDVIPIEAAWIQILAAILLLVFAFLSFSDAYSAAFTERRSMLAIPGSVKPLISQFLSKATLIGALIAGVIVAFVELPCTGAIYLGILSLLSSSTDFLTGLLYLLFYNLIFVAPLLLILGAAILGKDIRVFEKFTKENKPLSKALMGAVMIGLVALLLWPLRDFLTLKFQTLSMLGGKTAISSDILLTAVLSSIVFFYFFLAFFKPTLVGILKINICAICSAVGITWVWLLLLLILGFRFDTQILAVLLGMSLTGLMYWFERFFVKKKLARFWLFRITFVVFGLTVIFGLVLAKFGWLIGGLASFLLWTLGFFVLISRASQKTIEGVKKTRVLSDFEKKLENCC